ncbi:MAG: dihydroorotate dehydrogenase [bacterium]|nr:dihydroorotate dehydrogenase [bacterium]
MKPKIDLNIAGLYLKNPVLPASGTFGYGIEYEEMVPLDQLSAIITKGLTLKPREGNSPPRIVETACGVLNSVGLENIGIERFIKEKLPRIREHNIPVIVNIGGETAIEYEELAGILDKEEVEALEVNISCPNLQKGGAAFGNDPEIAGSVIERVRKRFSRTVFAKIPPADNINPVALACQNEGADAISLINTIRSLAIDIETQKPILGGIFGGLSGPAIKPVALRMVWEVSNILDIPVIGIGGIFTGSDAIEFILSGAVAVQVGTANLVDPLSCLKITEGIKEYMARKGIQNITQLVGKAKLSEK